MKYKSIIFLFSISFLLFYGCGNKQPTINMTNNKTLYIPQKHIVIKRRKGALYSQNGSSLFADKKDLQVGDILQVIVQERLRNDSKNLRSIKKNTSTSLGGGIATPMNGISLNSKVKKVGNTANSVFGVGFNSGTKNNFSGSTSSKVDEKFSTTISVIIEETYQNGNYYVKGSKELLIDGQKQYMAISGMIRPYDITPENTIYSHQLANLKIKYSKAGDENDANHKSWGTRFFETIWPF